MKNFLKIKSTLIGLSILFSFNMSLANSAIADQPYIAEIRQFPYTFCPRGWMSTEGQTLPIASNTALFSLLGTTYGGDGRTTFNLPNLQERVAKGFGNGPGIGSVQMGERGGQTEFTLQAVNMPTHTHTASTVTTVEVSSGDGDVNVPTDNVLADDGRDRIYNDQVPDANLSTAAVVSTTTLQASGNSTPVNRQQPFVAMRFCIAIDGLYPPRS